MPQSTKTMLAAVGTTGNNTSAGVMTSDDNAQIGFDFEVEAVGGTPTVTFKYQGSFDNSAWFDIFYVTDSSDTPATATRVVTTVGHYVQWLSLAALVRFYIFYRVVTTANTNVTYSASIQQAERRR